MWTWCSTATKLDGHRPFACASDVNWLPPAGAPAAALFRAKGLNWSVLVKPALELRVGRGWEHGPAEPQRPPRESPRCQPGTWRRSQPSSVSFRSTPLAENSALHALTVLAEAAPASARRAPRRAPSKQNGAHEFFPRCSGGSHRRSVASTGGLECPSPITSWCPSAETTMATSFRFNPWRLRTAM